MTKRTRDLPSLCLIADGFVDRGVSDKVADAVEAGVEWVQLRAHAPSDEIFRDAASRLVDRLREIRPDVLISVNARLDIGRELRTAFHTGRMGSTIEGARAKLGDVVIGASVHTLDEALVTWKSGADYVVYSPIFDTLSKPEVVSVGLDALGAVVRAVSPLPVYALGGITPERVRGCLHEGACGVAVLSGILGASDVGASVGAYLAALSDSTSAR